jgi:hypothetical protein
MKGETAQQQTQMLIQLYKEEEKKTLPGPPRVNLPKLPLIEVLQLSFYNISKSRMDHIS